MKSWPSLALVLCVGLIRAASGCPDHCVCSPVPGVGTSVTCSKITPTQRFDGYVSLVLQQSEDEDVSTPLSLTRKFFANLGMTAVDSISITVDVDQIDREAFKGLRAVSYISLTNNKLTYIHPQTFSTNAYLRMLSLSKNPLQLFKGGESPADGILLDAPNLGELDISSCQLYTLSPNAFQNLTDLVFLNLESNYLIDIDENTFKGLTVLEELYLSNNNIKYLHPNTFATNEDLFVLKLDHNPIASIENLNLSSATHLDLSVCKLAGLNSSSFTSLPEMRRLNLSGNVLTNLGEGIFSNMNELTHLDLSANKLKSLDPGFISENFALETLSLRDNPDLAFWPEEGFKGEFENLYRLDISNTGIQDLTPKAFENMPSLAQLDLSKNFIKSLDPGVLPRRLKYLKMEYNFVPSLDDLNFPKEFQLRQLFIGGNQIKSLNQSQFLNLPYIARLDVRFCGLEQIWSKLYTNAPYIKSLKKLNLSKNNLQKIAIDDLKVFNQLEMLDIRKNHLICDDNLKNLITYLESSAIEPIGPSNEGNIDENFERFLWDDVWTGSCNRPQREDIKAPVHHKDTPKPHSVPSYELDSPTDEGDEGDLVFDEELDPNEYQIDDRDSIPHGERNSDRPTNFVQINESNTSPYVVVFLTALGMTLVATLVVALITALCRQTLLSRQEDRKRRGRESSLSYQQLHENEHYNSPTTPIVKTKSLPPEVSASIVSNDNLRYPYAPTTYKITPERV